MRLSTLKRFLAHDAVEELLALARLDALASNKDLSHYDFCQQRLRELSVDGIKPPPLLRGTDLIALGHEPGPRFKRILDAVVEAQLEGTLHSREQAIEWVKGQFP